MGMEAAEAHEVLVWLLPPFESFFFLVLASLSAIWLENDTNRSRITTNSMSSSFPKVMVHFMNSTWFIKSVKKKSTANRSLFVMAGRQSGCLTSQPAIPQSHNLSMGQLTQNPLTFSLFVARHHCSRCGHPDHFGAHNNNTCDQYVYTFFSEVRHARSGPFIFLSFFQAIDCSGSFFCSFEVKET